jgi:hypothetical protein
VVLTSRSRHPARLRTLQSQDEIATGELRSIKDGKYRRILPEWVDEYIRDQIERQEAA